MASKRTILGSIIAVLGIILVAVSVASASTGTQQTGAIPCGGGDMHPCQPGQTGNTSYTMSNDSSPPGCTISGGILRCSAQSSTNNASFSVPGIVPGLIATIIGLVVALWPRLHL